MERRSFFGLLAGAVAAMFAPAKMFDFGTPKKWPDWTKDSAEPWHPLSPATISSYDNFAPSRVIDIDDSRDWQTIGRPTPLFVNPETGEVSLSLEQNIIYSKEMIKNWKSYGLHHTVTLPPSSGIKRQFFQYDKLGA
jgi:hypothetical protein